MRTLRLLLATFFALPLAVGSLGAASPSDVVKVFILAGQSNMEGKVQNKLLEHQARDPKTQAIFAHLRHGDAWIERDDVFVKFLERNGPLTIGYGSRDRTGVELEFGWVMGDHFDEPVLLIKTAWGGHSLDKLFRPPSMGMPSDAVLQQELDQAIQRKQADNEKRQRNDPLPTMEDIREPYGRSYRNMLAEVKQVQETYETMFPALAGKQLELAGFVWFQGWNDQYGGAEQRYEANMKAFIQDVRKDLSAPKLPFVIGVMGQNGSKPAQGAMLVIQNAQLAMQEVPAYRGNVKAVRTDVLIDEAAEALYPTWKQNFEAWEKTGSDHAYHYLGSAIWHVRMGRAFGEAMLELLAGAK
ncbi:MAG: sialate O-acetylesterase [Planctomycetes bacterium]|nr:sialate O-acetylesterase [Planctomycetota bacterium]